MGAAPPGAGRLPDRARDARGHPRLYAARAIRRPAVHVPRDGDPDLLARRERAAGAGTGDRPDRPQAAGNAGHRLPAQLFAPRRIADFLHDEGFGAREGRARHLVPDPQEGGRHRLHAAARRAGPVLQRRIRRRLHQHLDARGRRLHARATARLRGPVAHRAAARAGRRQGRLFRRPRPADLHRGQQRAAHAPRHLAAAARAGDQRAERHLVDRRADDRRRSRVRAAERPVRQRRRDRRHADPHQRPHVPARRSRDRETRLRRSAGYTDANQRPCRARHRRDDAAGRRRDPARQGARRRIEGSAGATAGRPEADAGVEHAARGRAFGRRLPRSRRRSGRDRAGGEPRVARAAYRDGRRDLDPGRARGHRAVHVPVRHRVAQGVARHARAGARAARRRRDHRGRDDGREARTGLQPRAPPRSRTPAPRSRC
ncbi:Uncharacterised protein [Burkholderia cenocepacia]|nr:Uncharacterised protein [Burkholderia cenocepacia]